MIVPVAVCRLGSPTKNNAAALRAAEPLACSCDQSCETHVHSGSDVNAWVVCLHDGVTDHDHCPNVALDRLTDADG